jgi:fumarate hydratase subunit beta
VTVEVLDDGRKRIEAPLSDEDVRELKIGDVVLVRGTVYAARDAAHKRMVEMLDRGEELPFDIAGQIVYYVGPTPERPGHVTGSAGPTTASRMDKWTPRLLELGLKGIMGKGGRGPAIRGELKEHTAVYRAALGGGGALAALTVRSQEVIAFEDLATEAIRRMELDDFPVWVVNDCEGRDFYGETVKPWRKNELLPESLHVSTDEWAGKNGGG